MKEDMKRDTEEMPESVQESGGKDGDMVITPWEVSGGSDGKIDYNKLVEQFGCQMIDQSLVERIERLTGKPAHPFLKRGVFFAHRDLHEVLDAYEKGQPFYLYTGRVGFLCSCDG